MPEDTGQQLINRLVENPEDHLTASDIGVDSALKTEDILVDDDNVALVRGDESVEDVDDECQPGGPN